MFELLASITREACEKCWRCNQIPAIPFVSYAALFDDINVVANL